MDGFSLLLILQPNCLCLREAVPKYGGAVLLSLILIYYPRGTDPLSEITQK